MFVPLRYSYTSHKRLNLFPLGFDSVISYFNENYSFQDVDIKYKPFEHIISNNNYFDE